MPNQIGIPTVQRLAAPFSITASTVLANVTGMVIAMAANSIYAVHMRLPFSLSGTASGFKFEVLAPAAPTNFLQNYFVIADDATITIANSVVAPTSVGNTLANAGNHLLDIYVYIETAAAGNLQLQWAQNVSDAGTAILQQGGIMWITQLK
jgi:hypothetical protein